MAAAASMGDDDGGLDGRQWRPAGCTTAAVASIGDDDGGLDGRRQRPAGCMMAVAASIGVDGDGLDAGTDGLDWRRRRRPRCRHGRRREDTCFG
jgi:hypothetical protein